MNHKSPPVLEYPPGATPLDGNEIAGLIPTYISTQGELNALEQENILQAEKWLAQKRKPERILSERFFRDLHRKMFGDVWRWAGTYRTSQKSIGIQWDQIPMAIKNLLDNSLFQLNSDVYPPDELGARLHHRIVEIHPFANGNGRHARYFVDALLESIGKEKFSWGSKSLHLQELSQHGLARKEYISALKEADRKNMAPLIRFVRS
jgi:Fic-DOC domain mobile mystery protein B